MTTADMSLDLTASVSAELRSPDQDAVAPSGWWVLPAVLSGGGFWVGLFVLIL